MGSYVRKDNFMSYENTFMNDKIVFEDKEYIVTFNTSAASTGYVSTNIFNKKNKPYHGQPMIIIGKKVSFRVTNAR